jgi:hypothetical protein
VCADDILAVVAEAYPDDGCWVYWRRWELWRCGGAVYDGYFGAGGGDVGIASGVFGAVCGDDGVLVCAAEGGEEEGVRLLLGFGLFRFMGVGFLSSSHDGHEKLMRFTR